MRSSAVATAAAANETNNSGPFPQRLNEIGFPDGQNKGMALGTTEYLPLPSSIHSRFQTKDQVVGSSKGSWTNAVANNRAAVVESTENGSVRPIIEGAATVMLESLLGEPGRRRDGSAVA